MKTGNRVNEPRVFITGASSGIGWALARAYAEQGAILGLVARRESVLHELAKELATVTSVYAVDVRDAPGMASAADDFHARFGPVDVVIASAGVSVGTLTEIKTDAPVFQEVIDINLIGMVNTFAPFIGRMRAARRGVLVGIASVAGFRGLPGAGAYSASKAAAMVYLESLRVELRGSGVDVVTISPGYIATPMTAKNPYRMPFLLQPDVAAHRMLHAIARGKRHSVIPWQMALVACCLKIMPSALYDALFARAPRKPRRQ